MSANNNNKVNDCDDKVTNSNTEKNTLRADDKKKEKDERFNEIMKELKEDGFWERQETMRKHYHEYCRQNNLDPNTGDKK